MAARIHWNLYAVQSLDPIIEGAGEVQLFVAFRSTSGLMALSRNTLVIVLCSTLALLSPVLICSLSSSVNGPSLPAGLRFFGRLSNG